MLSSKPLTVACLFGLSLILLGGCGLLDNKEQMIKQVVDLGNKERPQVVTPESIFSDYRVYREGETDEVVFEHTIKPDTLLTDKEEIKKRILKLLVGDESGEPQQILKAGIVFTFVYLNSDGSEALRHSVTKEDL